MCARSGISGLRTLILKVDSGEQKPAPTRKNNRQWFIGASQGPRYDAAMRSLLRVFSQQPLAAKVPEVTILFWAIKISTTAAG